MLCKISVYGTFSISNVLKSVNKHERLINFYISMWLYIEKNVFTNNLFCKYTLHTPVNYMFTILAFRYWQAYPKCRKALLWNKEFRIVFKLFFIIASNQIDF